MSTNKKIPVVKSVTNNTTPIKKSFNERFATYKKESPQGTSTKETRVNIMKVYNEDSELVAIGINGFYGAKDYFTNTMNCAHILLYLDRLNTYVEKQKISNIVETRYAAIDTTTPTVVVSAFPQVENNQLKEDLIDVLQGFMTYFAENGDPINKCPVKFNHLEDFLLDTEDKVNNYFFLSSLIQLPDRLKQN